MVSLAFPNPDLDILVPPCLGQIFCKEARCDSQVAYWVAVEAVFLVVGRVYEVHDGLGIDRFPTASV